MKTFITLIALFSSVVVSAKTIKEGDTEYQCVPKKTCEEKLRELQRQIVKLKEQIKELESTTETEYVLVEREKELRVTQIKKHILSVYSHRDVTNIEASANGGQAFAQVETRYVPGLSYQYQMDVGLVPMIGVNSSSHWMFGLGLEF